MRSCRAGTPFLSGQKRGKEPPDTLQIGFPDLPKLPKGLCPFGNPMCVSRRQKKTVGKNTITRFCVIVNTFLCFLVI